MKATAKTCYTRQNGLYLPQFSPLWTPALQKEYKDKITYVSYEEDLFKDSKNVRSYIRQLLNSLRR